MSACMLILIEGFKEFGDVWRLEEVAESEREKGKGVSFASAK